MFFIEINGVTSVDLIWFHSLKYIHLTVLLDLVILDYWVFPILYISVILRASIVRIPRSRSFLSFLFNCPSLFICYQSVTAYLLWSTCYFDGYVVVIYVSSAIVDQISEYEIIELSENVCNLKKQEADWILKIDIVEQGDKLEVR